MRRRFSCAFKKGVMLKAQLERLYEQRSRVSAAIVALERWREIACSEAPGHENQSEPSNLSTCRHA